MKVEFRVREVGRSGRYDVWLWGVRLCRSRVPFCDGVRRALDRRLISAGDVVVMRREEEEGWALRGVAGRVAGITVMDTRFRRLDDLKERLDGAGNRGDLAAG
jgi:hypothetical protein